MLYFLVSNLVACVAVTIVVLAMTILLAKVMFCDG